jgi:hypothetical protein
MRGRRFVAVIAAVVAVGSVGALTGAGTAGAATCATGTWQLQDTSLSGTVKTPYGSVNVTPIAGGTIQLTVDASTWSVSVDKSFDATGALPVGNVDGTVHVTGSATGTYKVKQDTGVVFRLTSGSGTAAFTGTVNSRPLSFSYPVKKGDVQQYLGIKGKALPSCTATRLTLRFKAVTLTFVPA